MPEINNSTAPVEEVISGQGKAPNQDFGQGKAPDITESGQGEVETDNTIEQEDTKESLPKNYKELQAAFTKKSQEFAEFKKQYEKMQEELNAFRQYYTQQLKQQEQKTQQKSEKSFEEMSELEKFNYLVDQRVSENVKPYIEKIGMLESYIQHLQQQEAYRIWNEFVKDHPDAVNYTDQLTEIITKHNMDLEKAYKLVKADLAPIEAKQKVLEEIQVKKDASKLQIPQSKTPTEQNTIPNSFQEAYERALKKIGAQ